MRLSGMRSPSTRTATNPNGVIESVRRRLILITQRFCNGLKPRLRSFRSLRVRSGNRRDVQPDPVPQLQSAGTIAPPAARRQTQLSELSCCREETHHYHQCLHCTKLAWPFRKRMKNLTVFSQGLSRRLVGGRLRGRWVSPVVALPNVGGQGRGMSSAGFVDLKVMRSDRKMLP